MEWLDRPGGTRRSQAYPHPVRRGGYRVLLNSLLFLRSSRFRLRKTCVGQQGDRREQIFAQFTRAPCGEPSS
jgi:hypothetical protein